MGWTSSVTCCEHSGGGQEGVGSDSCGDGVGGGGGSGDGNRDGSKASNCMDNSAVNLHQKPEAQTMMQMKGS